MTNNEHQLSLEEQNKLMEKYDAESRTRKLTGISAGIVFVGLLAFSLFQLYTGAFGQFTAYIQRTVHLGFALTLIFFLFPAKRKTKKTAFLGMITFLYWLPLLCVGTGQFSMTHLYSNLAELARLS